MIMKKMHQKKYSHQNAQTHPKQYISMYMHRYVGVSNDLKTKTKIYNIKTNDI